MHLKQTGYCVAFLLVYTFITITPPTGGRCAARFSQPHSHLAFHDDESNDLTTRGLRKLLSLHSNPQNVKNVNSRDVTETESSRRRPFKPNMAPTSINRSFRKRDTVQQTEGRGVFSAPEPPHEGCSEGSIQSTTRGKFTITGQLEANIPSRGYQSDSAVSVQSQVVQRRVKAQQVSGSEESWLRLQPEVECGDEAMSLTVRRRRGVQLLLDQDNESSVPLTQLPPQCGYSVQTSWKDLRLTAQYDACHVTQEDDHYVLPLLWRGTPVRMSCPSSLMEPDAAGPSSLCCSPYSLTVKVQGVTDTQELSVNVRGEWTPLVTLAEHCGYTLERHDAEVIITAPYVTCGITVKDGKHTLSLQIRGKTFTLTCPVSPTPTPQHAEPIEPPPWAPPFYLAPPFYPHPTYHHTYPPHGAKNPPPPEPPVSPQPLPPHDYQALYSHPPPLRDYYDRFGVHISPPAADREEESHKEHSELQQKQEKQPEMHSAERSPSSETPQTEAPPLQPPGNAFSQYYHYYHHPKIPLTGQPNDPDPGPEDPKQPSNYNLPPSVEPSEAPSSSSAPPESPEFTHKTSEHHTAHPPLPPQPYPYHYFDYFPRSARGEAGKSSLLSPIDAQNSKWGIFPQTDESHSDEMINFGNKRAEWSQTPLLPAEEEYDVKEVEVAPNPPSYPATPPSIHQPPFYPFYLHPYYFYHLFSGAESSTSSKQDLAPLLQATSSPPQDQPYQTPPPPTKPMHDVHNGHLRPYYSNPHRYHQPEVSADDQERHPAGSQPPAGRSFPHGEAEFPSMHQPLHPLYSHYIDQQHAMQMSNVHLHPYYSNHYLYHQPEVSADDQERHPAGSPPPSHSDYSGMDRPFPHAHAGFPSMHQQLHTLYSHYINQQHPYFPDEEEEGHDDEMKDQLEADLHAPSTSPCGHTSDFDCLYSENDCLSGGYVIFMVPDSAMEHTAASPGDPSKVFDQTGEYLFTAHGTLDENSPIRSRS